MMSTSRDESNDDGDDKAGLARRGWAADEDERLRAAIAQHGAHKWALIAAAVGTRREKQVGAAPSALACRQRPRSRWRPGCGAAVSVAWSCASTAPSPPTLSVA